MSFNYTRTYKDIYSVIKKDNIPHENAHNASLKITNALMDIYAFNEEHPLEAVGILQGKFGGYDLDDKGNPK